tara:strand:+ start:660 stop:989 length:330 start_codon:yes stop_codon:yes gene_type:complete
MLKHALDNSRLKRQLNEENCELEANTSISERVDILEKKLNLIIEKLESVEKGTDKMTSHIDFINDIYSKVQTPLFWICDRVNYMRGCGVSYLHKPFVKNELSTNINDQD